MSIWMGAMCVWVLEEVKGVRYLAVELVIQAVVRDLTGVVGAELRTYGRPGSILNHWAISPSLQPLAILLEMFLCWLRATLLCHYFSFNIYLSRVPLQATEFSTWGLWSTPNCIMTLGWSGVGFHPLNLCASWQLRDWTADFCPAGVGCVTESLLNLKEIFVRGSSSQWLIQELFGFLTAWYLPVFVFKGSCALAIAVVSCRGDDRKTKAEVPTASPWGSVEEGIFFFKACDLLHFFP